jgi:hypothetical protein
LRRILLRTTYINFMEKNPQKNASSKALKWPHMFVYKFHVMTRFTHSDWISAKM